MKGITIALYGINNLGKTTQAELLVKNLQSLAYKAVYQKYAVYDLEPSGVLLNSYFRENNPYNFSPETMQTLQVLNRTQFEPKLKKMLAEGYIVVMEDYTGTGIAWGMANGVKKPYLKEVNSHLLKEDIAFYFYGERFLQSKETGHTHEEDTSLMQKAALAHQELAEEYLWVPIYANDPIEVIEKYLLDSVIQYLKDHEKELLS